MNPCTIILLEDDELVASLFKTVLEHAGYTVVCASNSKDLTRLYQQHQPQLLITDLIMPDHEGIEGIFHLKEIANIPIIAISVNTTFLKMAEGLVTRTLAKPFSGEFLLQNVEQVLRQPRQP
jgi:DNA-binding response OmpR family regulator